MSNGPKGDAEVWRCPIEEYHADAPNTVSHSELETFIESPALYHGRHISRIYPRESSDALEFGQLFHSVVLGEPLEEKCVVVPPDVLTSNGHRRGKAWEAFRSAHADKTLLREQDFAPLAGMVASIQGHPKAAAILSAEGDVELGIRWRDPETGILCRCRPDKVTPFCVADLKSARSVHPKAFATAAFNLGYHRQAAWYQDGLHALTGERPPFCFIAVRKTPPYTCEVFELGAAFVELGRRENRAALLRLSECMASGEWESPTHGTIVELEAPQWAYYEAQWSLGE